MAAAGFEAQSARFDESGRSPGDPRTILTAIGAAIYDWDLVSDRIQWSGNAAEVFGLRDMAAWSSGRDFATLIESDSNPTPNDCIAASRDIDHGSGVPYGLRYTVRAVDGTTRAIDDSGRWYADAAGRPAFAHGMVRLERTGTGGTSQARARFVDRIASEVRDTGRSRASLSLVVAAVADLPELNQDLGFEAADAVLDEAFRRLRMTMRRRDLFARYAGNRFALALRGCPPDRIRVAIDRLSDALSQEPVITPQGPVRVRFCFGAATAPLHATDAGALLRCAEDGLVAAASGAGPLALYDPVVAQGDRRRKPAAPPDIVALLNERRIALAFQPVVDSVSRKTAFCEALLRVRRHDGTIAHAGDVVPAVERLGLIPLLDIRVLELGAAHLAANPDARLSINMSPLTLESADWLAALAGNLGAHPGIAPRLIVELTESVAIRDAHATRKRLDAMKALGIAIAIDDFGAGHTSFKHLRSFPVDLVKIDGAFVQNLSRSKDDGFFVRTLVDLAQHLGIPTVAEWVEDEETALRLADWGIDYLQGDHCGRPELLTEPTFGAAAGARTALSLTA